MQRGAAALVGFGDFQAFTDDDPEEKSTKVLVDEIAVARARRARAPAGRRLALSLEDGAAYRRRARRIGRGQRGPETAGRLLGQSSDLPARLTAPASGLFLERVFYDAAPAGRPLKPAISPPIRTEPHPGPSRDRPMREQRPPLTGLQGGHQI